jgi:hypothetical protein
MASTITVSSLTSVTPGSEFQLVVTINSDQPADIFSADLLFRYDPARLQFIDAVQGALAGTSGWTTLPNPSNSGVVQTSQLGANALSGGSGELLVLRFRALAAASGTVIVDLDQQQSIGLSEGTVAYTAVDGTVELPGGNPTGDPGSGDSGPADPGPGAGADPGPAPGESSSSGQPQPNQKRPSPVSASGSDDSNNRILGLSPTDPITGTDAADSLIPTTAGSYAMTGNGGPDRFVFAVAEQRKLGNAEFITDFSEQEGDMLVLYADVIGIQSIRFKVAKNRKKVRKFSSKTTNLIYDQSKGHLIVDLNGSKKGLGGGGGLMAVFTNDAPLSEGSFELLQELPPVTI